MSILQMKVLELRSRTVSLKTRGKGVRHMISDLARNLHVHVFSISAGPRCSVLDPERGLRAGTLLSPMLQLKHTGHTVL